MGIYNGSTKECIIDILSYDWPLSLKKIHALVKRRGLKMTYQAVHKAVYQLIDEGKLKKLQDGFSINLDWVKSIHDQTDIIRVNYFSKKRSFISSEQDDPDASSSIRVFIFNTWFDLEKYIYYIQKKTLNRSKDKKSICLHHNHEWRPLFYLRAEYNWIKNIHAKGFACYTLCSGSTVADQWSKRFYSRLGNKVLLNAQLKGPAEMVVFDDFLLEIYIPFELSKRLDDYLCKIKHMEKIDNNWLIENIFEVKSDIKLIIHHDKKLAEEARKHIMSRFW